MNRKQRTFNVNGKKIKIVSSAMTHLRNFAGWRVNINGSEYKFFTLDTRKQAEDKAYVSWVKENV